MKPSADDFALLPGDIKASVSNIRIVFMTVICYWLLNLPVGFCSGIQFRFKDYITLIPKNGRTVAAFLQSTSR
ncbi:hypothetical protein DSECCO2_474320 [anaerobic digester metagenome]